MENQDRTRMIDPVAAWSFWERSLPAVAFTGRFAASTDCARHSHPVPELVLVTEGNCRIDVGAESLAGSAGSLFILPAHVPQFQHTLGFTRTLYLGIRADPGLFDTTAARVLSVGLEDLAVRITRELCDIQPQSSSSDVVTSGLLLSLLGHLRGIEAQTAAQVDWHPGLKRAVAYIEEHQREPLQIGMLADHVCISPSHLTALFRQEFDCGPYQFQQRLRMDLACRLLKNPRYSIREVAYECGYDDANYFARLFGRHFGVSPQQWRQRLLR